MFYYADLKEDSWYRFVYDDSDNSVELCNVEELRDLGIEISDTYIKKIDFKRGSANWTKLKVLGFYEENNFLSQMLCCYKISGIKMDLTLYIDSENGKAYLQLYRYVGRFVGCMFYNWAYVYDNGVKRLSRASITSSSDSVINLGIPSIMVNYVLHLYSCKDFDGFMECVNNYFGSNIGFIVSDFGDEVDVEFMGWL